MKKRILSIVLAMSMIASVVVFCLAGPASAVQNTIKYPVYDEAVSLAAKPTVNLTFEGDNYGGIPIGRYTNGVKYVDGYAKIRGYSRHDSIAWRNQWNKQRIFYADTVA